MAIVRTLAFSLREMRSQWKILSRESHLYFQRTLQTAEQKVDCMGQGWKPGTQEEAPVGNRRQVWGMVGPPATGGSSENADSGHVLYLLRR